MTWQQVMKSNLDKSIWDDTETKTAIQDAYSTIYQRMVRTDNKDHWRGFQYKQNPIGSPAHFYNFIKRLLNDKRIKLPKQYTGWRDELVLTDWPSREFNRRWAVWEDISEHNKWIVALELDNLFEDLGWIDAKIAIKGDSPPYHFNDDKFKEWRQLQMDRKLRSKKND